MAVDDLVIFPTSWSVCSPDLDSSKVGKKTNKVKCLHLWWPLVVTVLIEHKTEVLELATWNRVTLDEVKQSKREVLLTDSINSLNSYTAIIWRK